MRLDALRPRGAVVFLDLALNGSANDIADFSPPWRCYFFLPVQSSSHHIGRTLPLCCQSSHAPSIPSDACLSLAMAYFDASSTVCFLTTCKYGRRPLRLVGILRVEETRLTSMNPGLKQLLRRLTGNLTRRDAMTCPFFILHAIRPPKDVQFLTTDRVPRWNLSKPTMCLGQQFQFRAHAVLAQHLLASSGGLGGFKEKGPAWHALGKVVAVQKGREVWAEKVLVNPSSQVGPKEKSPDQRRSNSLLAGGFGTQPEERSWTHSESCS